MRDHELRYQAVATATRDWEYWIGEDGRWVSCTPACEQITGFPADEFLADPGLLLRLVVAPEPAVVSHLLGVDLPDLGVCHLQFRILNRQGDVRWIEHSCHVVYQDGVNVGRLASNRDITERKESERILVLQRDLARGVAASASLDDTLRLCVATAIAAADLECGGVYLVRPNGDLELAHHQGLSERFVEQTRYYAADSRNAAIVRSGQCVYANALDIANSNLRQSADEGLTAVAIVPIVNGDEVVGCLNIGSHVHEAVQPRARLALEAIAAQIGPLIARERAIAALHDSEASLRSFFNTMSDLLFVLDTDATIRHVNPAIVKRLGYDADELIGQSVMRVHPPGRHDEARQIIGDMLAGRRAFCPIPLVTKQGNLVPVETVVTAGSYQGRPALFGVSRDVSEREAAAAELQRQHEDLARFNRAAVGRELRMLELEREVDALCDSSGLPRRYANGGAHSAAVAVTTSVAMNSNELAASHAAALHLMEDALAARDRAQREVIERTRAEHDARQALANAEVLVREIHHRVKNNLQVVSGLLQLQLETVDDPQAAQALRESQDRILSIAHVHEQLYRADDLASLDFRAYVEGLVDHLRRTNGSSSPAHIELEMPPVTLDLNTAIPCALVLNELVTNAFKHAFVGSTRDDAVIRVAWEETGTTRRFTVSDNGVGMPAGVCVDAPRKLGLRLVNMLARQLRGTVRRDCSAGCRTTLEFPAS